MQRTIPLPPDLKACLNSKTVSRWFCVRNILAVRGMAQAFGPPVLDAPEPICYKNFFAPAHNFLNYVGAYSAVAQWQSIRLLTEGL
jgi:hypothetical protein